MKPTDRQYSRLQSEFRRCLVSLKPHIADDYRATEDTEDTLPGMCVTFGVTWKDGEFSWDYQTGDNSYTGGAYGHRNWAVVYLYRRSNSTELAKDAVEQIAENIAQVE